MTPAVEKEPVRKPAGKLGNSFAAVAVLDRLQQRILSAQPIETREKTSAVLSAFFGAAERLKDRETEFTNRPRETAGNFDLKVNLRSPDHFTAIRDFKGMADELMTIDPVAGQELVKAVEKSIAARPKQAFKA